MSKSKFNDFGIVGPNDDTFEFHYGKGPGAMCRLEAIVLTERGPRRTEIADVPVSLWRKVSVRAVRELVSGMGDTERTRKLPKLKTGINRLSPLLGRELAVLLWALMEDGAEGQVEPILHGWRELAREERWWLFAKASSPGQNTGVGWRRALFYALSEPADTRSAQIVSDEKGESWKYLTGRLSTTSDPVSEPKDQYDGEKSKETTNELEIKKKERKRSKTEDDGEEESKQQQLDLF